MMVDRVGSAFQLLRLPNLEFLKYKMFCWNRLFTQQWERNTVLVSTKIKLLKDLYLQPGAIAFFTPNFNYSPFMLVSINL